MMLSVQLPWDGSSQSPIPTCSLLQGHRDVSWLSSAEGAGAGLQLVAFAASSFQDLFPWSFSFQRKPLLWVFAYFPFPFMACQLWQTSIRPWSLGTISISRYPGSQAQALSSPQPLWGTAHPSPTVLPGTNLPWRAWAAGVRILQPEVHL